MKRIVIFISLCLVFSFYSDTVLGYNDLISHPAITEKAAKDISVLGLYLRTTLGFQEGLKTYLP
jgi:hypothetical protein